MPHKIINGNVFILPHPKGHLNVCVGMKKENKVIGETMDDDIDNQLKDLIGKKVKEIRMDSTNTYIQFETDQGVFSYITEADCCSESWINHISGIQALIGEIVLKTDQIGMAEILEGQEGFSGKQEVEKVYSYKIFTYQGVCELEMRNASNGYYGGSLEKVDQIAGEVKPIYQDF